MEFLLHSLARKVRNTIIDRNPTNTRGYNEALNFWEMNNFSEKKKKMPFILSKLGSFFATMI